VYGTGVLEAAADGEESCPRCSFDDVGNVAGAADSTTQLALVVVAPTPPQSRIIDGARMRHTEAEVDQHDPLRSGDLDRSGCGRAVIAVAELTETVVAPAPGAAFGVQSTGMQKPQTHRREGDIRWHLDSSGRGTIAPVVAGPQLPEGVVAPAPSNTFGVDGATVVGADLDVREGDTGWAVDLDRAAAGV